jgi:hypothetical protein
VVVSLGATLAVVLRLGTGLAQTAPPGPAETAAPTQATFISTSRQQWDVVVDDQPMCATPCSGPLFPLQFVVLRSQESSPVLLEVGRLPPGNLVVSGKPMQQGRYAGGIVATTLGGMAVAIGITFTAVGMAKDRDGMSRAGLITGAAGVLALVGGIYLMLTAVPDFSIERASRARAERGNPATF